MAADLEPEEARLLSLWTTATGQDGYDKAKWQAHRNDFDATRERLRVALAELEAAKAQTLRFMASRQAILDKLHAAERRLEKACAAAQTYVERVDALGLAADDSDPLVMVTAEPIGAAQADLFDALGLLVRDEAGVVAFAPMPETIEQVRAERDSARMLADVRARDVPRQIRAWLAVQEDQDGCLDDHILADFDAGEWREVVP